MAGSMNRITLCGNVGADPEIRATASGSRVANLSLATNTYAGKDAHGNAQERTDWHRLAVWGRLVDVVEQYVKRGDRLLVEGEVQYRTVDKDDGTKMYYTDIFVKELVLLGSGPNPDGPRGGGNPKPAQAAAPAAAAPARYDDDGLLPF